MEDLSIVYLGVNDLKPYENNARKHSEKDINAIVESIKQSGGFNDPIGIWGVENLIVEGHGRLMAAKQLGMKTVPCIRLDHMTEEERKKYSLLHNKTAELSEWDFEKLEEELADLDFGDFDFGFEMNDKNQNDESEEDTPEDFKEFGEDIPTKYKCPVCGYEWN